MPPNFKICFQQFLHLTEHLNHLNILQNKSQLFFVLIKYNMVKLYLNKVITFVAFGLIPICLSYHFNESKYILLVTQDLIDI